MPKSAEEQAADEVAEQKAQREQLAKDANKAVNQARLDRLNAIADNSDDADPEKQDLVEMTDEAWQESDAQDQDEPPPKPKKKPEQRRVATDEDATLEESEEDRAVRRRAEREDRDTDDARAAGADDTRRREDGTVEYRVPQKDGSARWLSLRELRASAGHVEDDGDLQDESDSGRTSSARAPSPTDDERRQQAEQAKQARKARLKDLHTRASMGDEEAIDELAEIQAGLSEVNADSLQALVIQTVDARVEGRSSFEKAVDWFEDEYERELSSPRLKKMAARLDKEFASANPTLDPKSRLKKVGEELRSFRRELTGEKGDDSERPRNSDKLKRKQGLPQIREASGRQRTEEEPDEQVSTQSAIEQLARGRGQTRAIKH